MRQEKPMIRYRLKGKEKCKKIHFFNQFQIYGDINPGEVLNYRDQFSFYKGVEWIHFQNVEFKSTIKQCFYLMENQVLILENCTFHGHKIEFRGGSVEVLSPHIIRQGVLPNLLQANGVRDLAIHLDEDFECDLDVEVKEGTRFSLQGNSHIKNLSVDSKYIDLDVLKGNLSKLKLIGEEIFLGNQVNMSVYFPALIEANTVGFHHSFLKSATDIVFHVSRVAGESFGFTAARSIEVNGDIYCRKLDGQDVVFTELDLCGKKKSTRDLISSLKGMQRLLVRAQEDKFLEIEEQMRCSFETKSIQQNYQRLRIKK